MRTTLSEALRLAALGYPVFPCKPGEKRPMTAHGFKDASTDPAVIGAWWRDHPRANAAIATAGLVVVDVDDVGSPWYVRHRERLHAEAGAVAATPRGGLHFYFRSPADHAHRCSTGGVAAGIDIRSDGGYAVVPVSSTPDGSYAWVSGPGLAVRPDNLPEVPAWLRNELDRAAHKPRRSGGAESGRDGGPARPPSIGEGSRNCRLTSIAGGLRRRGFSADELDDQLQNTNRACCLPPLPEAEVAAIARSVARYPPGWPALRLAGAAASVDAGRPQRPPAIYIGTDEHRVVDEAVAALARDPDIYSRGEVLVRVIVPPAQPGMPPTPLITALAPPTLRERLTAAAELLKQSGDGEKPVHPPGWLVNAIEARRVWRGVRPLVAVATAPFLRPDGTICQTPGYDAATGVLYVPSGEFPAVHEDAAAEQVGAAVLELEEVVRDFRFERPEHRSAWVASVLTVVARAAFEGPAPMFVVDANVRGAGKGLLTQATSIIATGHETPVSSYPGDAEEMRKQITVAALMADPIILLDNVEGRLGNDALDRALTCTAWRDRLLGKTEQVCLPLRAVWFVTGNNVQVGADTARRVVHIRLDVLTERPEERTGFTHPNLLAWVRAERPRLYTAGLTILSAYFRAGCPDQRVAALGSYEGWSRLVRNACIWAGLADPCLTRQHLSQTGDSVHEVLSNLVAAWAGYDPDGDGVVLADLVNRLWGSGADPASLTAARADLRAALEEVVGRSGRSPTARDIGNKLRKYRRRVVNGCFLDTVAGEERSAGKVWRLFPVELPG